MVAMGDSVFEDPECNEAELLGKARPYTATERLISQGNWLSWNAQNETWAEVKCKYMWKKMQMRPILSESLL